MIDRADRACASGMAFGRAWLRLPKASANSGVTYFDLGSCRKSAAHTRIVFLYSRRRIGALTLGNGH
jgi:hypothetical protein